MSLRRLLLSLVTTTALAAACSGGGGDDAGPTATPTPKVPGPGDALAEWVSANRNVGFVPDCDDAVRGQDTGKLCASLIGERGSRRAYNLGPTLSEPTALAMLEQKPEGWVVLSVSNRDPSAPSIPGIPWPLQSGDAVIVIGLGEGDCLSVREQPTQEATRLICVPDGTTAIVQDELPVEAETYTWWKIAGGGFNGWAVGTWLRLEDAIADALNPATPES